jgi:hypothetical protein
MSPVCIEREQEEGMVLTPPCMPVLQSPSVVSRDALVHYTSVALAHIEHLHPQPSESDHSVRSGRKEYSEVVVTRGIASVAGRIKGEIKQAGNESKTSVRAPVPLLRPVRVYKTY